MSKYAEKKARKLAEKLALAQEQKEPEDEFSMIPDKMIRHYMRARAGMYGIVNKKYRLVKFKIEPFLYKRILNFQSSKIIVPVTVDNAEILGELVRDKLRGQSMIVELFCEEFGGKIRVSLLSAEECSSVVTALPCVTMHVARKPRHLYRPIHKKRYYRSGIIINSRNSW